jgi:Mg-chelatase subunit ChlD
MKKSWIVILVLLFGSFVKKQESPGCAQIDILLVGDFSSSVFGNEKFIADAFKGFIDQFELSETTVKMGIISFNENPTILSTLTSDQTQLQEALHEISTESASGTTNIDSALVTAGEEMLSNRGRYGINKIIILISDGDPDDIHVKKDAIVHVENLRNYGITVCSILILANNIDRDFMKIISNGCYSEANYHSLAVELKKLDFCM